jgi:hypothetical protein
MPSALPSRGRRAVIPNVTDSPGRIVPGLATDQRPCLERTAGQRACSVACRQLTRRADSTNRLDPRKFQSVAPTFSLSIDGDTRVGPVGNGIS